jgi:hypothetical protein
MPISFWISAAGPQRYAADSLMEPFRDGMRSPTTRFITMSP